MDETETLGNYLRRERELRKISLRELSKNTRVREPILKAIEEDRHDLLPSPTFVKGFLGAYAKFIGLDANDIILRYQRTLKVAPDTGPDVKTEKKLGGDKRRRWILGGAILGGAILVCLIASSLFLRQPSKPPVEPPPAKPSEQGAPVPAPESPQIEQTNLPQEEAKSAPVSPPPQAPGSPLPQNDIQTAPVSPPSQISVTKPMDKEAQPTPVSPLPQSPGANLPQQEISISLQLKAVETTWLSVKVDDQAERDMMLRPGETIPLKATHQIYMLVGNAGGLDLIHNGKPLDRFGKSGEVVTLTFTPQGLDAKRFEKPKEQ